MTLKVLTVDDSKTIRMIVKKAFKPYDCEMIEAENGVGQLGALVPKESFDCECYLLVDEALGWVSAAAIRLEKFQGAALIHYHSDLLGWILRSNTDIHSVSPCPPRLLADS